MTIIVVGNTQYTTSLLPDEQSDHGHENLEMGDSTLKDGQIILKENPPPDGIYIACKKGDETVFKVGTDGAVDCETLLSTGGIETKDDGAMVCIFSNHVVEGSQNYIRVGRQENIDEQVVGLLDGIEHKREIDGDEQEFKQQLHPSVPKLSISGTTNEHVNWMEIKDSDTDNTVFAVHGDGTVQCEGWENPAVELPDNHNHSLSVEANSLYIGASKISIKNGFVSVYHLKPPPYIPKNLREAPYSLTVSNIDATIVRSINDWMRLARSTLGGVSSKSLRLRHMILKQRSVSQII